MANINFKTKINSIRPFNTYKTENIPLANQHTAFESDRGRIINSAAIRRLQQKTQVFPLERNAAVRSRLTHSMEVQQVGRFIVQSIFKNLSSAQLTEYGLEGLEKSIESLVEMSCLMHDIGNPPFGHFGEEALNQWFRKNIAQLTTSARDNIFIGNEDLLEDLKQYEGNAQAIRLIHSLLSLNLTYTQAAGILKYTRPATMKKSEVAKDKSYLMKKVGYYFAEKEYVNSMMTSLNIEHGCRHPISYIMEAADDISYCLADIEDAVEKGILSRNDLSTILKDMFEDVLINQLKIDDINAISQWKKAVESADKVESDSNYFIKLRVALIHPLVEHATTRFIDNIEAVYHGTFNQALLEDNSRYHAITQTLKQIALKYVFCNQEVEKLELQGFRIISGLLDAYKPLLELDKHEFELAINKEKGAPLIETRLCNKLPIKHKETYLKAVSLLDKGAENYTCLEFYYRCRLIQDYISGMTDQFAYDEYRMLMVIE